LGRKIEVDREKKGKIVRFYKRTKIVVQQERIGGWPIEIKPGGEPKAIAGEGHKKIRQR